VRTRAVRDIERRLDRRPSGHAGALQSFNEARKIAIIADNDPRKWPPVRPPLPAALVCRGKPL